MAIEDEAKAMVRRERPSPQDLAGADNKPLRRRRARHPPSVTEPASDVSTKPDAQNADLRIMSTSKRSAQVIVMSGL
jgi:hypothetical protein